MIAQMILLLLHIQMLAELPVSVVLNLLLLVDIEMKPQFQDTKM